MQADTGVLTMTGHTTYLCLVTVLLACIAVKLWPVVESIYYNFNALMGG